MPVGTPPADITPDEYLDRISSAQSRFPKLEIDALVVYADRESFADLLFLTGMDPRFEEAIYVLPATGQGTLLLGNENFAQEPTASLPIGRQLFQALSPSGQRRDRPVSLERLLRLAGVEEGMRVGVAGGKTFSSDYLDDPVHAISAPAYLVDALRKAAGSSGDVINAEGVFTHPDTGLRSTSSAHQIAIFEYAASVASQSVLDALPHLHPGVTEQQFGDNLYDRGLPHSCHTIINFGPRQGLYSATPNPARMGDAYTVAFGLRGGLTCRAGAVAAKPGDLPPQARTVYPELVTNYFDVVAAWHEALAVGATCGAVFDAAENTRDASLFEFSLNPGHFLHHEEWSESAFTPGSTTRLRSGMMVQCDIIPKTGITNVYVNIEDGLALADERLRTQLANEYPQMWDRVQARRDYLATVLGVELDESALPMSNMQLWHAPYVLDPELALTRN
jgi:Xaa-Pro aminopeptidase